MTQPNLRCRKRTPNEKISAVIPVHLISVRYEPIALAP
jgi:hypothetical protein